MGMRDTSLTIRRLERGLKQRLRLRAAGHNRSMEEEAREILRVALASASSGKLGTAMRRHFAQAGFVDLPLPPRAKVRRPPDFE
jgi:plasmid stability protein